MYYYSKPEASASQGLIKLQQEALKQGVDFKIALTPEQEWQLSAFRRAGLIGGDRSTYIRMLKPKKASPEFMKERGCFKTNRAGVLEFTSEGHTVTPKFQDWDKAINQARKDQDGNTLYRTGQAFKNGLLYEVDTWSRRGLSPCFMPNLSTGFNAKQVTHATAIFVECDGLTLKEQDALLARFIELGLPPTLVYFSGGKSYHFYWTLEAPTELIDVWVNLQERVAHMIGAGADKSLDDPGQLMRLGGFSHVSISKGSLKFNPGRVVHESNARYTLEELDEFLPALPEVAQAERKRKQSAEVGTGNYKHVDAGPWDMRTLAQYLEGYNPDGRPNWGPTCKCPAHDGGSFDSLHINKATGRYKCQSGCTPTEIYRAVRAIAEEAGHSFEVKKGSKRKARIDKTFAEVRKLTEVAAGAGETVEVSKFESLESPGCDFSGVTQELDTQDLSAVSIEYGPGPHFLKSAKGTAKTQSLKPNIKRWMVEGKRILLIGHRNILLGGTAKEFGMAHHQDIERAFLSDVDWLAITADSLPKLDSARPYDIVIIDEGEQELVHSILGGTCKRQRSLVTAYQEHFARHANTLVVMDADASDVTKDYWMAQRPPGEQPNIILNRGRRPGYAATILVSDKIDCFLGEEDPETGDWSGRLQAIQEGKRVFIFCTSMTRARQLNKTVEEMIGKDNVQLVCSRNSGEESQQIFVKHINELVTKFQVIITTTSMGTGVSITGKHFDEVWGIGSLGDMPASVFAQGLSRVRDNSIPRHIWLDERFGERRRISDPEVLRHRYLSNANETCLHLGINPETNERESRNGLFLDTAVKLEARDNHSINEMMLELTRCLLREGNQVSLERSQWTDEKGETRASGYRTLEVLKADCKRILEARDLTKEEATEYRQRIEFLSEQQKVELERYGIQQRYPWLTEDVVMEHLKAPASKKPWLPILTLKSLIEGEAWSLKKDEWDTATHEMITDWNHNSPRRQILDELGFGDLVRDPTALFTSEFFLGTWKVACQDRERVHRLLNYSISEKMAQKEGTERRTVASAFFAYILKECLGLKTEVVKEFLTGYQYRKEIGGVVETLGAETTVFRENRRGVKSNLNSLISFDPPSAFTILRLSRHSHQNRVKERWGGQLVQRGLATQKGVRPMRLETMQERFMEAFPEEFAEVELNLAEEVRPVLGDWEFAEATLRHWEPLQVSEEEAEAQERASEQALTEFKHQRELKLNQLQPEWTRVPPEERWRLPYACLPPEEKRAVDLENSRLSGNRSLSAEEKEAIALESRKVLELTFG